MEATPGENLCLLQYSETLLDDGQLHKPSTVITLPVGDMCIADSAANQLLVVAQDTHKVVCELTGGPESGGSLKQPRGLACDATALYVSEASGSRVRKMRLPEQLRPQGAETPRQCIRSIAGVTHECGARVWTRTDDGVTSRFGCTRAQVARS